MKNKRGFTLIELLAVFAILGILITVVIPFVGNMIENSKKDTYISNARLLESAAEDYYLINPGVLPSVVDATSTVLLSQLITEGLIDQIKDPFDNSVNCDTTNSYVTITFSGDRNYEYEITLTCGTNMIFEKATEGLTEDDIVTSTF